MWVAINNRRYNFPFCNEKYIILGKKRKYIFVSFNIVTPDRYKKSFLRIIELFMLKNL